MDYVPLSMEFSRHEYQSGSHSLIQGSSQSRDWTQVSCITGRFFTVWAIREAPRREPSGLASTVLCFLRILPHWFQLAFFKLRAIIHSVQFILVTHSCLTLCYPMDCSKPGLPVHHQLPEFTQIHVLQVSNAIQQSHLLLSPSPPAFNLSQHQGLFKWVSSLHQMAKVLEFQLQHQPFQWTLRTDLL